MPIDDTGAPLPDSWRPDVGAAGPGTPGAALAAGVRCPLDDRGMLAIAGRDAADFLQSQLSSDVRHLAPGRATLTAYCDPRGRVLAAPRLIAEPDRFLLELPADQLEPVRTRLARYVLRADVRLGDVSAATARFGVAGDAAADALARAAGALPEAAGACARSEASAVLVRLEGPRPRWLVYGDPEAVAPLWDALADDARAAPADAWRLLAIEAGVPRVGTATAGRFVAQMLNLDRLEAIDFRKGCFPGQEVLARTRNLGRLKRRMFVLRARATGVPAAGTAVYAGQEAAGEVIDAVAHPDGGSLALAVLRIDAAGEPLRLGAADGPGAEAQAPPYALEEAA